MRLAALAIGLLATFASSVSATALTYKLEANEKACFHSYVEHPNSKIAYYFAVRLSAQVLSLFREGKSLIWGVRFNPVVHSMSITLWYPPMGRWF